MSPKFIRTYCTNKLKRSVDIFYKVSSNCYVLFVPSEM